MFYLFTLPQGVPRTISVFAGYHQMVPRYIDYTKCLVFYENGRTYVSVPSQRMIDTEIVRLGTEIQLRGRVHA